jgi:hypothetical protein
LFDVLLSSYFDVALITDATDLRIRLQIAVVVHELHLYVSRRSIIFGEGIR